MLSLVTLAVLPMAAFAPAAIFAQQTQPSQYQQQQPGQPSPQQTPTQPSPSQTPPAQQPAPQQTPTQPAPSQTPPAQPAPQQTPTQPAPSQTPPAQPAPQQTPTQPAPSQTPPAQPAPQQAPTQPAPQPAMPEPQATGPTTTIEGAVTNVVVFGCGTTATAAMNRQPVTAGPSSVPGASAAGSAPAAQQPPTSPGTGPGCSAVLVITPGVNWAQLEQIEATAAGENGGGAAGFGGPLRVVLGPQATVTTKDNAGISLLDLPKGSVVKVDYAVRNDVPVATNVDVIWHAGQ
jgi:hypothetical protein